MLILSRVCADFHNRAGQTIFTIRPGNLLSFLEAPDEIQSDPLFAMLQADGSLEAVKSVQQRRDLESDPVGDTTPEGKKPRQKKSPEAPASIVSSSSTEALTDSTTEQTTDQVAPARSDTPADPQPDTPVKSSRKSAKNQ